MGILGDLEMTDYTLSGIDSQVLYQANSGFESLTRIYVIVVILI